MSPAQVPPCPWPALRLVTLLMQTQATFPHIRSAQSRTVLTPTLLKAVMAFHVSPMSACITRQAALENRSRLISLKRTCVTMIQSFHMQTCGMVRGPFCMVIAVQSMTAPKEFESLTAAAG